MATPLLLNKSPYQNDQKQAFTPLKGSSYTKWRSFRLPTVSINKVLSANKSTGQAKKGPEFLQGLLNFKSKSMAKADA